MSSRSALLYGVLLLLSPAAFAEEPGASEEAVDVTVVGTLQTGVVAIGGETTGFVIRSKGIVWELEFGSDADLRKKATKLNGKKLRVQGSLEHKVGVEVADRWIVTVRSLQPVSG